MTTPLASAPSPAPGSRFAALRTHVAAWSPAIVVAWFKYSMPSDSGPIARLFAGVVLGVLLQTAGYFAYSMAAASIQWIQSGDFDASDFRLDHRTIGGVLLAVATWAWLQRARHDQAVALDRCVTMSVRTLDRRGNDDILTMLHECVDEASATGNWSDE